MGNSYDDSNYLRRIAEGIDELLKLDREAKALQAKKLYLDGTCNECRYLVEGGWIPSQYFNQKDYYRKPAYRQCMECHKQYCMEQA